MNTMSASLYATTNPKFLKKTVTRLDHPGQLGGVSVRPIAGGVLRAIHTRLTEAIPGLRDVKSLSGATMDQAFRNALASNDAWNFKRHYFEANVLKRFQDTSSDKQVSRAKYSIDVLLDSEIRCAVSNEVLYHVLTEDRPSVPRHIKKILRRAKNILHSVLRDFPWEDFPRACGFSSGATNEFPRKAAAIHNKWVLSTHITPKALPYFEAFCGWAGLDLMPRGNVEDVVISTYNKVFTVPKNFERDRTACKPSTWNCFFQKGVGKLIGRRLQKGPRLLHKDAQLEHRVLAKIGSATGLLATLDLKGASDSISISLIDELFPEQWKQVLFDLREEYGLLPDGTLIRWEKLSTMGNGFTFEVETALFYALVKACCGRSSIVSVYGDDIICPSRYADLVSEVMMYCGFEINREKSFTRGKFRESCGGHYFDGRDVKPFYITNLPNGLNDIINLHNDIVRWTGAYPSEGSEFFELWRACRAAVPRAHWGPPGKEGCLWAEWDDCRPIYIRSLQAFVVKGLRQVESKIETWDNYGSYLQKLWESDLDVADASERSHYKITCEGVKGCWLVVDRTQWNRLTAETLCT